MRSFFSFFRCIALCLYELIKASFNYDVSRYHLYPSLFLAGSLISRWDDGYYMAYDVCALSIKIRTPKDDFNSLLKKEREKEAVE